MNHGLGSDLGEEALAGLAGDGAADAPKFLGGGGDFGPKRWQGCLQDGADGLPPRSAEGFGCFKMLAQLRFPGRCHNVVLREVVLREVVLREAVTRNAVFQVWVPNYSGCIPRTPWNFLSINTVFWRGPIDTIP